MAQIEGQNGGTLTPFEKGKSGNPKGKQPGKKSFKRILKEILSHKMPIEYNGRNIILTKKEVAMLLLVRHATDEDQDPNVQMKAVAMIMEKLEPKALEAKNTTGQTPGEFVIVRIPSNGRDDAAPMPNPVIEDAQVDNS